MIETQRMVASKLETVESRAANAQQKLEATMNELDRANHNYQLSQKEVEHLREQIKTGIENRPVSNTEKEFDVASLENESKERELVQLTTELAKTEEKHALQVSQLQKQIQDLSA